MNSTEFRKELVKIMPGYKWTVQRSLCPESKQLSATGIQTSGFNRLTTLNVVRREKPTTATVEYEVKYSGYGKNAPWLSEHNGGTLARALRSMQEFYEAMLRTYDGAVNDLQRARKA